MKLIECVQGSPEWLQARLGVPTASMFDAIVTPTTLKLSASAKGHAYRLLAERATGQPHPERVDMAAMRRGRELEPMAAAAYDFHSNVETFPVGFILSDCGRYGASPDRLTNDMRGGVEIKCPLQHTHIGYAVEGMRDAYKIQRQGQLLVADLEYVDLFAFYPEMPPVVDRMTRDEAMISKLRDALEQFSEMMAGLELDLRKRGFFSSEDEEYV